MNFNLYLLYLSINSINRYKKNIGVTRLDLIKYFEPFLLFYTGNNSDNTKYFDFYFNFLINIKSFTKESLILEDNNIISINTDHPEYKAFLIHYHDIKKKIQNTSKYISSSSSNSDEFDQSDDSDFDESEESEESELDADYFEDSELELDSNDSEKDDEYYICNNSDNTTFYLLNKNLTYCSCKSYDYCTLQKKSCKHLDYYCNKEDELHTVNINLITCTCDIYKEHHSCKHIVFTDSITPFNNH